jgi:hypothetical protein
VSARHWLIPGDFLWTDEGARFGWNMRLRGKQCVFETSPDGRAWRKLSFEALNPRQRATMSDPQLFLDYVQQATCPNGRPVYAQVVCRSTNRGPAPLIDPGVDLCRTEYSVWRHNAWIMTEPGTWGERRRRRRPPPRGASASPEEAAEPADAEGEDTD